MIDLQDQQVMHQYFSELLFQPLVEDLKKVVEIPAEIVAKDIDPVKADTNVVVELKHNKKIDLLPLPQSTINSATEQVLVSVPAVKENQNGEGDEVLADEISPQSWADYHWDNGRPLWAQEQFDCLLFEVCGFNFAVPLITLGQIQAITDDLSPVFGQAPWFMGLQNTAMGKMRVVNTALFVMPERYKPDASYKPSYMISIANCPWALAVDNVNQPISLSPQDVKWRVQREKQAWLAGVVKKQMCVLIDIPALALQLMQKDKNSTSKNV